MTANKHVEMSIYLKSMKKPLILTFDTVDKAKKVYNAIIEATDVVDCGQFIFSKSEFRFAIYNFKKF